MATVLTFTTKEVAKQLGISEKRFLRIIKRLGITPTRVPNRRHRFMFTNEQVVALTQEIETRIALGTDLRGREIVVIDPQSFFKAK